MLFLKLRYLSNITLLPVTDLTLDLLCTAQIAQIEKEMLYLGIERSALQCLLNTPTTSIVSTAPHRRLLTCECNRLCSHMYFRQNRLYISQFWVKLQDFWCAKIAKISSTLLSRSDAVGWCIYVQKWQKTHSLKLFLIPSSFISCFLIWVATDGHYLWVHIGSVLVCSTSVN